MTERTLTVRLRAVANEYTRVLEQAGRKTEELATRADRVSAWGEKAADVGGNLTRGLTLPIAGVGAAALLTAGQYEAAMREVQALTGASTTEMERLSAQALKMGADTQFSATQAADAMSQLIKGGFDTRQTFDALPGVMQLAAAAGLDIASAADIATNVLSGFGLEVEDLAEVNDYLAQTANSSDTDVRELGEAFKYVGPVARGAGLTLEETAATLGLLAENGIRGEMAGTALRGMLTGLLNPSEKSASILADLGVSAVDSTGQLVGMAEVLDQLAAGGATTADVMQVFGQRAGPAMIALLGQGSEALRGFTGNLSESRGVAQDLADAKMGGLTGAVEQLKGSLETLAITVGEAGLIDFATGAADAVTGLVNSLGALPVPVQRAGIIVGGLAAAAGPAIWAFGKLSTLYGPVVEGLGRVVGQFQGMQLQMRLAQMEGVTTGRALATVFGPAAGLTAGVIALGGAYLYLRNRAEEVARTHQSAGDSAAALAESAGIALRDIDSLVDAEGEAVDSAWAFQQANAAALDTLRELGDTASKQNYIAEVGYQLVQRGASPEDAFAQVQQLAEAAGVELPVSLTVESIGDFENQVVAAVDAARRAAQQAAAGEPFFSLDLFTDPFTDPFGRGLRMEGVEGDLRRVADAAGNAWKTDDIAGYVRILGEAEAALGDNADAANYLADEAMKSLGDGFGFSVDKGASLRDILDQVASGATDATSEQRGLAREIRGIAREMDGGLTPANIAAAAAQVQAAESARRYAEDQKAAGDAAGGAEGAVGDLGGALDDQAAAAEAAEEAFQQYLDTLRGATDPLFGMLDAFRGNEQAQWDLAQAQAEYDAAVASHGPNSLAALAAQRELTDAQIAAARSAQDVMISAEEMNRVIEQNPGYLQEAHAMLMQWADQGLISADTAARLAEKFSVTAFQARGVHDRTKEAQSALEGLDGTHAKATAEIELIGVENLPFISTLFGLNGAKRELPGAPISFGGGKARGGPMSAGRMYLTSEEGAELLVPGASGTAIPAGPTAALMTAAGLISGRGSSGTPIAGGAMSDVRIVAALHDLGRRVDALDVGHIQITETRSASATAIEVVRRVDERRRAARL